MTRLGGTWENWARTAQVRPQRVERPATADAVHRAVGAALARGQRIKAVGAGHSFTAIAVAPGVLLDLSDLSGLVRVDRERSRVTLLAGTRLHRIPALLAPHGLAMQNLGDIDRQSISGAISTGTHGTGAGFGGLATQLVGATLVTGEGEVLRVDDEHHSELLPAIAVGLGALGILLDVTIQCVPAFLLRSLERRERLDEVLDELPARVAAADHFEFFWFPHTDVALTKTNTRLPASAARDPLPAVGRWLDETVLSNGVFRVACAAARIAPAIAPRFSRLAVGLTGVREYTDASALVYAHRRAVRFREMEYALPAPHVRPAFEALRELIAQRRWRISFPVEVRFAAADGLWLSTASERETGYIAVHRYWREDPTEYFDAVEQLMLSFGGRPHWGKMHSLDAAALRERYPRLADFLVLRERLDPQRAFANAYLDRVLGE